MFELIIIVVIVCVVWFFLDKSSFHVARRTSGDIVAGSFFHAKALHRESELRDLKSPERQQEMYNSVQTKFVSTLKYKQGGFDHLKSATDALNSASGTKSSLKG